MFFSDISFSNKTDSSKLYSSAIEREELSANGSLKLSRLQKIIEAKLPEVIALERSNPSYQRARLSNGGVKPEGILQKVIKIDSAALADLSKRASPPKSDDPEAYIAFLERCATIECLADQQVNRVIPLKDCPLPRKFPLFSTTASFFPYNGEGMSDYGWGCCWRATQTVLSALVNEEGYLTEVPTFEKLFHLFGSNAVLKKIYQDFLVVRKGRIEKEASKIAEALFSFSKFSSYQHAYGWSNPFVSQLMFHYYNLDSDMIVVNDMPASLKAENLPLSLCSANIGFAGLKDRLVAHFSEKNPLPVVIDDGKFAMAMVGVEVDNGGMHICFADPHIKGGANNPASRLIYDQGNVADSFKHSPDPTAGVYSVTFDADGKQIGCSVTKHEVMFSRNSYEGTQFHTKPWMATFPRRT
jgi:hypothetical protein